MGFSCSYQGTLGSGQAEAAEQSPGILLNVASITWKPPGRVARIFPKPKNIGYHRLD